MFCNFSIQSSYIRSYGHIIRGANNNSFHQVDTMISLIWFMMDAYFQCQVLLNNTFISLYYIYIYIVSSITERCLSQFKRRSLKKKTSTARFPYLPQYAKPIKLYLNLFY